jgi:hypothetical protein
MHEYLLEHTHPGREQGEAKLELDHHLRFDDESKAFATYSSVINLEYLPTNRTPVATLLTSIILTVHGLYGESRFTWNTVVSM